MNGLEINQTIVRFEWFDGLNLRFQAFVLIFRSKPLCIRYNMKQHFNILVIGKGLRGRTEICLLIRPENSGL